MALVNTGLQVSGYANFPLACALWVMAALLALWGARPWLSELWSKAILATDGQPKEREAGLPNAVQSSHTPLTPDTWLSDAMWWAFLRTWRIPEGGIGSLNVGESEKQRFVMLIIREFRQLAFEGKLTIWGWKKGHTLWEEVPQDFWARNQINHIQVARGDHPDEVKAYTEKFWENPDTTAEWSHFKTSKAAIEQMYPSPR
jgi:hypothetical protein